MPIAVTCPSCGKSGLAPDQLAGKTIRCKQCSTDFEAKAEQPTTASPSAQVSPDTPPTQTTPERPKVNTKRDYESDWVKPTVIGGVVVLILGIPLLFVDSDIAKQLGVLVMSIGLIVIITPLGLQWRLKGLGEKGSAMAAMARASWGSEEPADLIPGIMAFKGEEVVKREDRVRLNVPTKDMLVGWKAANAPGFPMSISLILTTHRLVVAAPDQGTGALGMWRVNELKGVQIETVSDIPSLILWRGGGNELLPGQMAFSVAQPQVWEKALKEAKFTAVPTELE